MIWGGPSSMMTCWKGLPPTILYLTKDCSSLVLKYGLLCSYWSDFVQTWHRCSPGWIDVPTRLVSLELYQYHWYSSKCKQTISFCVFLCDYWADFVQIWHRISPEWIDVPPRLVSLELYHYHWYSSKYKQTISFCLFLCDYWADFCSNLAQMFPRVDRCAS